MTPESLNEYADYLAFISCLTFPFIRAICRRLKNIKPMFKASNVRHDIANGLLLPYFILIAISPIFKGVHIDQHAMALAGIYGTIMILTDLIDHGVRSPSSRTRSTDKPEVNGE